MRFRDWSAGQNDGTEVALGTEWRVIRDDTGYQMELGARWNLSQVELGAK